MNNIYNNFPTGMTTAEIPHSFSGFMKGITLAAFGKVIFIIVNDMICSERLYHLHIILAAHDGYFCPKVFGKHTHTHNEPQKYPHRHQHRKSKPFVPVECFLYYANPA
jgi:hypothetical protein